MTATPSIQTLPGLESGFPQAASLRRLCDVLVRAGGRPVAVGGAVRDHLRGIAPKDVDVEVYGAALATIEPALAAAGFSVHAVGRFFGVLKVTVDDEPGPVTYDVAMPRRESKSGQGHKGFVVESDPHMSFAEAAARRDFTINAIGVDLASGDLLDPHGGVVDLRRGVLRHISDAFDEDPLRVLRAAQFAARFGFSVEPHTVARCRSLLGELPTLAAERLWEEMKKLLLAPWPSLGLQVLKSTGAREVLFPELAALEGCPQEPEWHPEGDVWIHTLMVTDEAAQLCRRDALPPDEALLVVMGALCHDLGKPPTTAFIDGRVRSKDHEAQGEAPTRSFLQRLNAPPAFVDDVVALVKEHLKPFMLWKDKDRVSDGALRRLSLRVPLERLVRVATADHFGRTTADALAKDDAFAHWLLGEARRLRINDEAPKPVLLGRHLIARGLRPQLAFKEILAQAFEAQLEGHFHDEESGGRWLDSHLQALRDDGKLAP